MKKVSAETIISWTSSCKEYPPKRIKQLFGARKFATAKQILQLDLPPKDLLWCVLRPELIDDKTRQLYVCWHVEWILCRERKEGREPAEELWEAVKIAKRFANRKVTKSEREKARSTPRSAATITAADAAWSASWAAARSAAWLAAYEDELAAQVKQLKKMLG